MKAFSTRNPKVYPVVDIKFLKTLTSEKQGFFISFTNKQFVTNKILDDNL